MFFGEYQHNLDTKGRLSIPAKFRGECGDHVYTMRGHEGCLDVYTEEGWQTYYAELKKLSNKKKEERAYLRMVTSRMSCSEFDKLGRINIPQVLRTHAHLEKECTIVGAGEHIEIWDTAKWDAFYDEYDDQFDDLSERISENEE